MKRSVEFTHSLDRYGYYTPFQIALEAWRRGLKVTFVNDVVHYRISSGVKNHSFYCSGVIDDDTCLKAHQICRDKADTKKYLAKNNIAVPQGKLFDHSISDEAILSFAETFSFPLVLKPNDGNQGNGVFANIKDLETLKEYLTHVRQKLKFKDVLLEERIEGDDLRIFFFFYKVVAVLKRVPANITGNGIHSIKKLIRIKNLKRSDNLRLRKSPIIIDKEIINVLKSHGYNLKTIPKKGENLILRSICNMSAGGDSVDITENIPDKVKDIAIQGIKAIPGLQHGSVDMLYNVDNPDKPCVIIEINSYPRLTGHLYPWEGKPREVIAALVDYYFPESIPDKGKNRNLFFDFDSIRTALNWQEFWNIMHNNTEVTLPPPETNNIVSREIVVSGKVHKVGFRYWAKNQANNLNLFGFAENIKPDKVRIVVAGEEENVKSLAELCKTGPLRASVDGLVLKETNRPVYLGFYIKLNTIEYLRHEFKIALRLVKQRIILYIKQKKILTSDI